VVQCLGEACVNQEVLDRILEEVKIGQAGQKSWLLEETKAGQAEVPLLGIQFLSAIWYF
jgi:hypothetical protein